MEISEETNTLTKNLLGQSSEENFEDALDCLIDEEENVEHTGKRINSPLQELSSSDLEYSIKVRQKYGLAEPDRYNDFPGGRVEGEDEVIVGTLEKLARRLMDDLIMGRGGSVEEGHVLLNPFLATLELSLCHRYGKSIHDLWHQVSALKPEDGDMVWRNVQSNVDNVRGFTLLRTGLAKLRAWLRLALMNKTLVVCLNALRPKISYEKLI